MSEGEDPYKSEIATRGLKESLNYPTLVKL